MRQLFERAGDQAVGFKLIYNQLLYYKPLSNWIADESVPIIHLQRKNILKAAISLVRARETGVYVSSNDVVAIGQKVLINPTLILDELKTYESEKSECESHLLNNPMLNISYEDFFADQSTSVQLIMNFLGIDEQALKTPNLVKTNPEKISERLENFEEVRQALAGTPWENFLD